MGGSYESCAYRVEIPCECVDGPRPTAKPTLPSTNEGSECLPSLPILIDTQGQSEYPDPPLTITGQNTTHVSFTVSNTFDGIASSIFTEYHSDTFGQTECLEEEN